ncbi:HPP family protein [Poseidonibacter ostreae]|jgi:CBS-domain-containing membrane protein|uniref:HPP family protein n=1 Tax=Poseidonibacter ostreae TaxID=2654171 RepID=A0A6L4WRM9_9BACT|nr:HPP family protein [Poseidonibacter ostreae]KAB7887551.1 HPP family protein [Poseidonibacter ostreae]KAB7888390.1 HPP family protein [Poseidonibacter ostreae]KAB7888669.1 HPP family protein [Poseidonibacter ostreae]MAC84499.1 HPP family protein [Arcobacter sp.]|tara:strand:- start:18234 stop:18797 length:564 start_codon:yes stop_codon:yes gene_type:complete
MKKFLQQFKKVNSEPIEKSNIIWSWIASFLGILAISYFHQDILNDKDLTLVIASFGASAVLIYGAVNSPLAQPRNLVGGHILSAIIGVASFKLFSGNILFCSAFAVASAILVMQLTLTLHPPGGATALIAVIGSKQIHDLGFLYVLVPVASGAFILLIIALLVNNIPKHRSYPLSFKEYKNKWLSDD